jgi:hypothetical protein
VGFFEFILFIVIIYRYSIVIIVFVGLMWFCLIFILNWLVVFVKLRWARFLLVSGLRLLDNFSVLYCVVRCVLLLLIYYKLTS